MPKTYQHNRVALARGLEELLIMLREYRTVEFESDGDLTQLHTQATNQAVMDIEDRRFTPEPTTETCPTSTDAVLSRRASFRLCSTCRSRLDAVMAGGDEP